MNIASVLADLVVLVGWPLNAIVTFRLLRMARRSPLNRVLRDRAIVSVGVLLLVIVFGLVFQNNDLLDPPMSFEDTKIFTRLAVAALAIVPALYWTWLYWPKRG